MKTRKQLSNRVAAVGEETNQANYGNKIAPSTSIRSPSPPRLRDRRISGAETKTQISTAISNGQSPSPPAGAKRPSTGPTRILPKRACGKSNSLLANIQPQGSAINYSTSTKLKLPLLNRLQTCRKEDTHETNQGTSSSLNPTACGSSQSTKSSSLIANKTAIIKSYSKDSLIRRDSLPEHDNSDSVSSNDCNPKSKLVRISLPENSGLHSSETNANDKNRYIFTSNGLKQIGTSNLDVVEVGNGNEILSGGVGVDDLNTATVQRDKVFNILLGVTGSVAAIKLLELTTKLKSMFPRPYISKTDGISYKAAIQIKIVMTTNAKHFSSKEGLVKDLNDPSIEIYDDNDEWDMWKKMGDPVLHIELRKWADLCLIAPLDANTMAKLSNGICDNLLTCVVRAWDVTKPLVYCPAMNVHMYNHPITKDHLSKLQSYGYSRVDCVEKRLACGDIGIGGMATVESISKKVIECLFEPVTRKVSLSKPILNQQPTYPIIPTTGSREETSRTAARNASNLSNQILNRFKTSNQITIHAVPSSNLNGLQTGHVKGIPRRSANSLTNLIVCQPNERTNQHSGNRSIHRTSGVTSVKNLCAIGMTDNYRDLNEELDNNIDEEYGSDFDPSRLLEQTMITDESITTERGQKVTKTTNAGQTPDRKLPDANQSKASGLTPLFNTSKFLALCHNKDKGCYTCAICKHDYKNRKSMARHFKEQHVQGNIYHCKPCNVSYKRREKLIKHNRERHPETE